MIYIYIYIYLIIEAIHPIIHPMKNHHFPMVFLWFSYGFPEQKSSRGLDPTFGAAPNPGPDRLQRGCSPNRRLKKKEMLVVGFMGRFRS